jgi:hypothetical protein
MKRSNLFPAFNGWAVGYGSFDKKELETIARESGLLKRKSTSH